jgi:arylsulfatase A-like enzyme
MNPLRPSDETGRPRAPHTSGRAIFGVILLLFGALLSACTPALPEGPNLVLVTLDTTRFDHTSLGSYERDTTPRLRALAAEGASFELAYAPTATTGPTHATLFTSLLPPEHGVIKNGVALDGDLVTLADHLSAEGWRTAAFVSSYVMSERWGWSQGFGHFDDVFDPAGATKRKKSWEGHTVDGGFDRRASVTTTRARAWLERQRDGRPFFLFVHYYDPHAPYLPPVGFSGRFPSEEPTPLDLSISAYDEEIAYTDDQLGSLLDALDEFGLAENTLVVVTADHGEGLLDHGHMGHGVHLYDEQVRVPLLVRLPGVIAPGIRPDAPVEMLDVAPTLAELLGVPVPVEFTGRNLAPVLRGEGSLDPLHPVRLFRRHYAPKADRKSPSGVQYGVRVGDWKYIERPAEGRPELYNLRSDPGERHNVFTRHPDVAARLAPLLVRGFEDAPKLAPEEAERLEALGYVE